MLTVISPAAASVKPSERGLLLTRSVASWLRSSAESLRHPAMFCLPPLDLSEALRITSNDSMCRATPTVGSIRLSPAQRACGSTRRAASARTGRSSSALML